MAREYVISVCGDEVQEGSYIKSVDALTYLVQEDYDFGAIDPKDLALEMYHSGIKAYPGIRLEGVK